MPTESHFNESGQSPGAAKARVTHLAQRVPASPTASVPPPPGTTTGPERSTTSRGLPTFEDVDAADAGL